MTLYEEVQSVNLGLQSNNNCLFFFLDFLCLLHLLPLGPVPHLLQLLGVLQVLAFDHPLVLCQLLLESLFGAVGLGFLLSKVSDFSLECLDLGMEFTLLIPFFCELGLQFDYLLLKLFDL